MYARSIILAAVIAVVSIGIVAGITSHSGFGSTPHAGISVATEPIGLAVLTDGTPMQANVNSAKKGIPPGAVLAGIYGRSEIYVSQRLARGAVDWLTHGYELCMTTTEPDRLVGTVCSPSSYVEENGLVTVHTAVGGVRVEALLPNGVHRITVIDNSGESHLVLAKNNVAAIEDADVAVVRYMLSGGNGHTEYIPAGFVRRRAIKTRYSST